ncbi:hypothetical protein SEA_PRINGAR_26 [Mycobacterium phage Pringar]|uniref:Uncharacterized protein n=1 Tax=Mycobacterium phage Pringar TaxID=2652895 RepID=A0A5P8DFH5_9CAUD|nr:hypothetical protein SEA_PRINGAR_26 [Mycobacterium phage Pringar]
MTLDFDDEFQRIANAITAEEAFDLLDRKLEELRWWTERREARGDYADLRTLITTMIMSPNQERGTVIACLAAALWRLREMEEKANAERRRDFD